MPALQNKFYAQSAGLRWVLLSANIEKAAIRFMQLLMHDSMKGQQPINSDFTLIDERVVAAHIATLGPKILISESGFDGVKVGIFESTEVVQRWRKQMSSLEKMILRGIDSSDKR